MDNTYYEKIRLLLDEEGLINKELTFGCIIKNQNGVRLRVFKVKPSAIMFMLEGNDS